MYRLIPIFGGGGGPGLTKIIYIIFGALIGAVFAPAFCDYPKTMVYCVLVGSVSGGVLGWLGWRSANDYKSDKAKLGLDRQSRIIEEPKTAISAASEALSFPGWVKVTIFGSIFLIILAIVLSSLYYIGVKLLMFPAFILLLAGLALFAIGMSAARHYDKQSQ
jgi:hypothetical protein